MSDSYLDSITKATSAKKYSGKNIRTKDGTIAYVTASGLMKGYTDETIYNETAGFHGCPANFAQINQEWASLGVPTGAVMAKGQACGFEHSYVTAAPPETNFDPTFYKAEYPDLASMTDPEATNHWNTYGMQEGRLPNGTIMQSMTALGQVGYVDTDAVLHNVPADSTAYGQYKTYKKRSNITGSAMLDCTPTGGIKYGNRVVIVANDKTGSINSDSVLKFGSKKTELFIRPIPNSTDTAIRYGDKISLARSITSYSSTCGYWGCSVSFVNTKTMRLEFGPGGESGGTQFTVAAPEGYKTGDALRYGAPFSLTASLPTPNYALFQGDTLYPGDDPIPSANGQYTLSFLTTGELNLYSGTTLAWSSKKTDPAPKKIRISDNGSLEAINANGVVYWSTETTGKGSAPFALAVQDDGRMVLLDGAMTPLFSTPSPATTSSATMQTLYASVAKSEMRFGAVDNAATFTFTDPDMVNAAGCDLLELQQECTGDCIGFVHNPAANEWQKITKGATAADYKIAPTLQDVYVKTPTVKLNDTTCELGAANFIDPTFYSNYVAGSDLTMDAADQCAAPDMLAAADGEYAARMQEIYEKAKEYENNAPDLPDLVNKYKQNEVIAGKTVRQYKRQKERIKKAPQTITYSQQQRDSEVVDRQNKVRFVMMAIAAAAVLGLVIVVLKRK